MTASVRLRIDLAYDGAPFVGFARQPDLVTVQGTLEDAASRLFGQAVTTVCAGRTDRGVHAFAQVCHLDIDRDVERARHALEDLDSFRRKLDHACGPSITIWQVRRVSDDFDARRSAQERTYRYKLADDPLIAPLDRFEQWWIGEPLSVTRMREAAQLLLGEHDFAAFCRRREGASTRRRLTQATITRAHPGRVDVRFIGTAFCHQQVRSMVGCLVEVGRGTRPPEWIAEVLDSQDRSLAARVAPPHGLTLERVSYGRRWPASPPPAARALIAGRS